MKKILIPTDFSENAFKALKYAIHVADNYNADICILHAYQISSGAGRFASIDYIIQEDRENELKAVLRKIQPLLGTNIKVETMVKNGGSVDMICRTAEKIGADLIIMGTIGASGLKKIFMGSTTSNVIKNTDVPVLAVPNNFKDYSISNITLALDHKKVENSASIELIKSFTKKFESKLNLLIVVDEDNEHLNIDADFQSDLKESGFDFNYFRLTSPNVSEGMNNFVIENGSDLLCILHHTRDWMNDFFHSSISKKMAMECQIPLLILRD